MWKEQTKSGKFKYCDRYTDPVTGKVKKVSVTLDSGKRSDEKLAREILSKKVRDAMQPESKDITFGELCQLFVSYQEKFQKPQTAQCERYCANTLVKLVGADPLVKSLSARYVSDKIYSNVATTYNHRLALFKTIIRWGYCQEYVRDISFLDRIQRMKDRTEKEKVADKFLDHDEIEALLPALKERDRL